MITRGDIAVLTQLQFNRGDLLALLAITGWACYAPLIHRVPAELGLSTTLFFIVLTGSLMILPLYVVESLYFRPVTFSQTMLLSVLYLGVGVSAFSIFIWNAGIRSVGPNRAVIMLNLIPVFGVLMAIGFLGEHMFAYHVVGAAFVALGIGLVIVMGRRAANGAKGK
ncbi:MAG: DMT family transporter, partial [Rhodospirillales bacterium]|nr:DMT family transporter [Rhodospirillales bacterium]